MLRIATIVTSDYISHAERLLLSLRSSGNRFHLIVYCEDPALLDSFVKLNDCSVRRLPSIRSLGVKRAKFQAYRDAIEGGDFLYLDADVVVLESLEEIAGRRTLAACPDDLSGCPRIADKLRPWPAAPELQNRVYVNSGVLFIPASEREFIEYICAESMSDELWARYIAPGVLYDNHFLCAYLNLEHATLELLDETVYNWQGFYKGGQLQVLRRGDNLLNRQSGKELRLVHFAGIQDIDRFLCDLPPDISSLICARSMTVHGSPDHAITAVMAGLSRCFSHELPDPFVKTVFRHSLAEVCEIARNGFEQSYFETESYFRDPDAMLSLVYSRPNSSALWNGLRCGGAYLDGDEYNYLFGLVKRLEVGTVIETGAGETSILFRRAGVDAYSLEAHPGPWLDRAAQEGCRCFLIPFNTETRLFELAPLQEALAGLRGKFIDLLFIDSPGGTPYRSRILLELLEIVRARYILFHDVHRDAGNVFRYAVQCGLKIVDYFPSRRGLVLLSSTEEQVPEPPPRLDNTVFRSPGLRIAILAGPRQACACDVFTVMIELENGSDVPISSSFRNPICMSYHWYGRHEECLVYDGIRTPLPFDIGPHTRAAFPVRVLAPAAQGQCRLQLSLVQEGIAWFHAWEEALGVWMPVLVTDRPACGLS